MLKENILPTAALQIIQLHFFFNAIKHSVIIYIPSCFLNEIKIVAKVLFPPSNNDAILFKPWAAKYN